jgi:hypothetical protein
VLKSPAANASFARSNRLSVEPALVVESLSVAALEADETSGEVGSGDVATTVGEVDDVSTLLLQPANTETPRAANAMVRL